MILKLLEFHKFIVQQSDINDTWKFWSQFIFKDCFVYIALFIAIRGGNWQLRIASLKLVATLFADFDKDIYQRIIPNHLADIACIQPHSAHSLQSVESDGYYSSYSCLSPE